MLNKLRLGRGLAWTAWLVFIASLFMPVETHNLAGPCAWPCQQPLTYYGWQNASFFIMSIVALVLNFLQVVYIILFDPGTLGRILESLLTMGIYAVIGLGQFLIVLAPLWPARIKKTGWQRLYLWTVILSALSALAYGVFPDLRLGLDLLRGYYWWLLSFVLMLIASILLHGRKSRDFSPEAGQLSLQKP